MIAKGRRALLALAVAAGLFAVLPMLRKVPLTPRAPPVLSVHSRPQALPNLPFTDANGTPTSLAAFHGRVVLLNVWATWCPSCREEKPTLDRLQATLGGPGFEVVALSIDRGGMPVVQEFFLDEGIRHLRPYVDASGGDALAALGGAGIPLTLLIGRDGREIGRKSGPATWDDPQMVELIRGYLAPAATPPEPARR